MLSCDYIGYQSRMVFLDENEVIAFQKYPWNALFKNGILLKYPYFKTKLQTICFQSNTTTQSFLYIQKPFIVAEIVRLRY